MKLFRYLLYSPFFKRNWTSLTTSGPSGELLKNKTVIRVTGPDSESFLQGLMTNDVYELRSDRPVLYTMFLNAKGRVFRDALIYKLGSDYLLECDQSGVDGLTKHLKMYRLKKKVEVMKESELEVWAVFDKDLIDKLCSDSPRNSPKSNPLIEGLKKEGLNGERFLVSADPRLDVLGARVLTEGGRRREELFQKHQVSVAPAEGPSLYTQVRYKLGVAEGASEIPPGEAFPLEYNLDYLSGVSFSKGCYIGQELTARTYHTGVVRKRVMPLLFERDLEGSGGVVSGPTKSRFPLGRVRGAQGRLGLGLMRVSEALAQPNLATDGGVGLVALRPFWWPPDQRAKPSPSSI